jgi:RNA polymerase sigma factor (sigma-70 family)
MALGQLQMTQEAEAGAAASDAALVAAARAGDREAFGRLVERHQALVCAVTCGGTADPSRGKDLAQETFLEAWRSLANLRDPAKLRPWLCGIARHVTLNARRDEAREATTPLDEVPEPGAPDPGPAEQAVLAEERAMVARALAEVPEAYREALILFYWEDKSSARVADAFGLTEEAARQRVARGRRMLRDHVVAVVEEGLRRARPGRAFKVAVLAAFPAGTPEVAAAATSSVAATAAKASLSAGFAGGLAGSLLGVAGGVLGAWASITNTRSPRERQFMVRMTWVAVALCLGLLVLEGAAVLALARVAAGGPLSPDTVLATILTLFAVGGVAVFSLILWSNRRQRQIRVEDGTDETHVPSSPATVQMPPSAIYGSHAGFLGEVLWMLPMCWLAGDWPVAGAVIAFSATAYTVSVVLTLRRPERYFRIAFWEGLTYAALLLAVLNLRWDPWMAAYRASPWYEPMADWPLWLVNVLVVILLVEGQRKLLKQDRLLRSR